METNNKLNELKDRNPFRVPEGYFENFTENMMCRLPDFPVKQPKVISIYDRVKPWLYMAAVFAGLIVLFGVLNKMMGVPSEDNDSFVKTTLPVLLPDPEAEAEENDEFLEYIHDMYTDKYAFSYMDDYWDN
ncbi:MAG: hypothetical protein LBL33_06345 [Tannerella sp.]|jgi:hypothetical protein|nr:hypothetical protein [Tannerella sp.]